MDATIVRLILLPATMALLGNANWYIPKWLDRVLPNLDAHTTEVAALPEQRTPERVLEPVG